MVIPKKYKDFFLAFDAGERITLQDEQTKLFIRARNKMYSVTVDKGIVQNKRSGIKKCDFLCYEECGPYSHLIELKGAYTQDAPKQIQETVENIMNDPDISFLVNNVARLDAYIVSPGRQEVPRGVDDVQRQITRILAKRCTKPVENIDSLLKFVKVVPSLKRLVDKGGRIICSNDAPLIF